MAPAPSVSTVALQAALDGNLRLLKKMAEKVDLRGVKDDEGQNVLHAAARMGHLEVCKFLVDELGLDVNSTSAERVTPMLLASINGNVTVLQYLLSRGGDPAVTTSRGTMPLHNAAEFGHCEAVRLLLSKGVPVDPLDHRGTPLHMVAVKDQDQTMMILLEHGADLNRVTHHLFSPLVLACSVESMKCMKLLLQAGADVNFRSSSGPSALMYAVHDGFTDIVKFLLEVGADPNIPDLHGKIPIIHAAECGRRELVEILFPHTRPVPSLPDWSVDGIIETTKYMPFRAVDEISMEDDIINMKAKGKEFFVNGEYLSAIYSYGRASNMDPLDATLFANLSLCWLRVGDGKQARRDPLQFGLLPLSHCSVGPTVMGPIRQWHNGRSRTAEEPFPQALADALQCRMLRPDWSKAWYREGAALSLIKNYRGAVDAFMEALKLDPSSDEIKKALREAVEAMKKAARSDGPNP